MALSYVQYAGNGSTATFAIPFPYLDRSHIEVRVALDVHAFTWDDPNTIRITPPPAAGAVVEARRHTPRDTRMVDFVDGSVLTETDLDLANIQTFYIVQEAIDIAGGTLELLADGSYGAGGRRIANIGTAVDPRDAITKEYHDGTFLPQMNALLAATTTARDGAVTAREGAEAALAAAVAARDLALQYRDTTKGYRDEVSAWNANVNAKSANVDTKSANVDAKAATVDTQAGQVAADRTATQGFRNEAEGFKNAAAASAAAAQTWDPANYYNKTEINGQMAGKASLSGAVFSGSVEAGYLRVNAQGGNEGGEIQLAKPVSGTSLASDVIIDVMGNQLRICEAGGTFRGVTVDFTGTGSQSALWHAGNFNPATKVGKNEALPSITGSIGPWSTGGWGTAIQLRQANGIQWLSNGNSLAGFVGISGNILYVMRGPDATTGSGAAATAFNINLTNGAVYTEQLGDLNNRIENRADQYAAMYANARVSALRLSGYGEIAGTGGMTNVAPSVFTGAAGTAYGAQTFGYRTLQYYLPNTGWVNFSVG